MAKAILNGNEIFGNIHMGEGGGTAPETVLTNGVISTDSAYATASFSDVSDFEYIFVRFRTTTGGSDYTDVLYIPVTDLTSEQTYNITLHRSVQVGITKTTVRAINYSGAYIYIYADIIGLSEDLFD